MKSVGSSCLLIGIVIEKISPNILWQRIWCFRYDSEHQYHHIFVDIHHKLQHHKYKDMPFIDGLPSYKMAGSFHGKLSVSHNQMLLVIFQFHSHHFHPFPSDPGSLSWQNLNPKRDSRCINSTMIGLGSSQPWLLRHVGSFGFSGSPWADFMARDRSSPRKKAAGM